MPKINHLQTTISLPGTKIWVAGGALLPNGSDVDLFCVNSHDTFELLEIPDSNLIVRTKNATTINVNGTIYQFCSYRKNTLLELIQSFDFAHCQVGCEVCLLTNKITGFKYTENYLHSRLLGTTWFTGSEYPFSSLIRAGKYYKNNKMSRGEFIKCVTDIFVAVSKRGVKDYEDFKDQLDAVDLGLLPEEIQNCQQSFKDLYEVLLKS